MRKINFEKAETIYGGKNCYVIGLFGVHIILLGVTTGNLASVFGMVNDTIYCYNS